MLQLARASDATVILPGNVYVYGKQMPELLTASTPHNPTNHLGEIRRDMDLQYKAASKEGIQTIILCIGDFLQRESTGNWFDTHMTAGLAKSHFAYPGRRDVPTPSAICPMPPVPVWHWPKYAVNYLLSLTSHSKEQP